SHALAGAARLARNDETVGVEELSPKLRSGVAGSDNGSAAVAPNPSVDPTAPLEPIRQARAAFETRYIAEALRRNGGNVSQTARVLGISRVMLQKKMKAFGLR